MATATTRTAVGCDRRDAFRAAPRATPALLRLRSRVLRSSRAGSARRDAHGIAGRRARRDVERRRLHGTLAVLPDNPWQAARRRLSVARVEKADRRGEAGRSAG